MSGRILITGSRDWTDAKTIRGALKDAWHWMGNPRDAVVVHGECHLGGADRIAAEMWASWGFPVEGHPAETGPTGHVLGPKRNAHMVSLGADVCLAFPLPSSRGTKNCMRLAREAGIPVKVYEPQPHHAANTDPENHPYRVQCSCGEWCYDFDAHLERVRQ